ncbi:hypothetical protein GCM10023238_06270 [Streptomyces heliomycini]
MAGAVDPGRTVESVQTRTELAKLRTALQEAVTRLDQADPAAGQGQHGRHGAGGRPAGEAPPTRTAARRRRALLFLLLGVVGHLAAARTSRRPRTEPEIAAALGSTPLFIPPI